MVFAITLATINDSRINLDDIPTFLLIAKSFFVILANGYLILFHVYLYFMNITTFEYFSKKKINNTISPERFDEHNLSVIKDKSLNEKEN